MIRLLKIELRKHLSYRAFWLMIFFYAVLLAVMIFGIPGLIDYIAEKSGEPSRFRIFKAIVFNFPDIWQNITFVASTRFFIKLSWVLSLLLCYQRISFPHHPIKHYQRIGQKGFLDCKTRINGSFKPFFDTGYIFLRLYLGLLTPFQNQLVMCLAK